MITHDVFHPQLCQSLSETWSRWNTILKLTSFCQFSKYYCNSFFLQRKIVILCMQITSYGSTWWFAGYKRNAINVCLFLFIFLFGHYSNNFCNGLSRSLLVFPLQTRRNKTIRNTSETTRLHFVAFTHLFLYSSLKYF